MWGSCPVPSPRMRASSLGLARIVIELSTCPGIKSRVFPQPARRPAKKRPASIAQLDERSLGYDRDLESLTRQVTQTSLRRIVGVERSLAALVTRSARESCRQSWKRANEARHLLRRPTADAVSREGSTLKA